MPSGQEYEPILLNISYGNDQLFIRGFSKSLTLEEFKVIVSEETRIKTKDLRLKRIVNQGELTFNVEKKTEILTSI